MAALHLFSGILSILAAFYCILCIRDTNKILFFIFNTIFVLANSFLAAMNLDIYIRSL